jgi:hypothetical protein
MRFLDCLAYLDPDGAAPGAAASKAAMMAVTARTGSPSGISRPRRSEDIAARIPLPPTTWATRPLCGSPPCARAAGAPPPVTRWKAAVSGGNPIPGSGVLLLAAERHAALRKAFGQLPAGCRAAARPGHRG